jgi:hypothetical protein
MKGTGRAAVRVVAWLLLGLATVLRGEAPAEAVDLLAKAREHLGGEKALARVESLRYEGTVEFFASATRGKVRILLEKPSFQRMEIELPELHQVVAVEDLQGWEMIVDHRGEEPVRQLRYLRSPEYWKNHFVALENLWFHHGYRVGKGTLAWEGESVFEGRLVGKVSIRYDQRNIFTRRFEKRTGALVVSVGNDGTEVRERDWIVLEGVRFPRVMEYYREGERTSRMTFESIEVNPRIDPALFRYPVF